MYKHNMHAVFLSVYVCACASLYVRMYVIPMLAMVLRRVR